MFIALSLSLNIYIYIYIYIYVLCIYIYIYTHTHTYTHVMLEVIHRSDVARGSLDELAGGYTHDKYYDNYFPTRPMVWQWRFRVRRYHIGNLSDACLQRTPVYTMLCNST